MSRFDRDDVIINNGEAAWDAKINDATLNIFDRPFAIHEHTGDETDLEATFPAANNDRTLVWVDHSVDGWTLYYSDGTVWAALTTSGGGGSSNDIEAISGAATIANGTEIAVCSGTTYTVTLPAAATVGAGKLLYVKKTASGDITIDGNASETIDGDATYVLTEDEQAVLLVSDGSNWLVIGEANKAAAAGAGTLTSEAISGADTIDVATDIAICSGTTYTVTLPAAASYGAGRLLRIKKTASGTVTVDGNSTETIDGATTVAMEIANTSLTLYCDGSNWLIV